MTLAIILHRKNFSVSLWSFSREYATYLDRYRKNPKFLKGIRIPSGIKITSNIKRAVIGADLLIVAVPSIYLRKVIRRLKNIQGIKKKLILSVTKGIEPETSMRMSQVIKKELAAEKIYVLSGPTIALEVARNHPATAVIAGRNTLDLKRLQELLSSRRFRVYRNTDVIGVELGGSLKNIIAIACGISDGLGFGANAKAAILARGLNEMRNLAHAMGARRETLNGISGLGDLVTTCVSKFSRNRFVGEQLAKGKSIKTIKERMRMVAEGITTVKAAYKLSHRYKIEMPITKEIYNVVYKGKKAPEAVDVLMSRRMKTE